MAPVKDGVTRRGSTWSYVIRVSNPVTGTIRPGRRGEVLHLRWTDVDLEAGLLRFEGSTNVIDGERINGTTKGGRSRVVSSDAGTVAVLKDHQSRQEADQELAGPEWRGNGRVFTTQMGAPLYPDTVTQLVPKLIEAHNNPATRATRAHPAQPLPKPSRPLPLIRLHDLRHLHATLLLLEGVPVHIVANRLGHSDPAVTLRVYAHVLHESAAGVVADIFARAVSTEAVSKSVSKNDLGKPETRGPVV
jgi:integrase